MLEDKDIQKLKEELATKEDFKKFSIRAFETFATKEDLAKLVTFDEFDQFRKEVKEEFTALREQVQTLTISVDKLVKAIENLRQEYFAIKSHLDRHEKWIKQLADKLGVKLEY